VLVWKLTRNFAPGDLIAYADESKGHVNLGRIDKPSQEAVFVKRNDGEPASVLHSDIIGKVITVLWRGTPQATSHVAADYDAVAGIRSGPVSRYPVTVDTTGEGKPPAVKTNFPVTNPP
jgi:hypothetical protein